MPNCFEKLRTIAEGRGKPFRILIVDDEPWVQEVFKDFCEITDAFDVKMAGNGTKALEMIRDNNFDLVTLDLIMPEMSGMEVLSKIKNLTPNLPVIIITGNATDKLINEAGVMGACQVIYKPVLLEEFVTKLTSTLVKLT